MKKRSVFFWLVLFDSMLIVATITLFILAKLLDNDILFTLYIVFMVIAYNFLIRLGVGMFFTLVYDKKEYHKNAYWYKTHRWEMKLYRFLKINKWKDHMITAKPELFDVYNNSFDRILHNMLQAEIVHEVCFIMVFFPILLAIPYGAIWVFVTTSIFSAILELPFIAIQRYNRPRVIKIMNRLERKE